MDESLEKVHTAESPTQSSPQSNSAQIDSVVTYEIHGHMLSDSDVDNPKNWPLYQKLYACSTAFALAFAVAFGLTGITPSLSTVSSTYSITTTQAITGSFSLYLFGIFFTPIFTPHLSERYGRVPVYLVCFPMWMLFVLGTGLAQNFATVAVCRFFAGLTGGPTLVLIEGTFADVWSAGVTGRYYAVLTAASYVGAACGPLINGFIFAATSSSLAWTQWPTLLIGLAAYLFSLGTPETYARAIVRRRARRHNLPHLLPPAESGVSLSQMVHITLLTPAKMLLTEPLVILISAYLALNFALLFQWFITVPVALKAAYGFDVSQVGLAFIAAIVGVGLAVVVTVMFDRLAAPRAMRQGDGGDGDVLNVEYRLYPAMVGCLLLPTSLFWVGWTASPKFSWATPVVGTGCYVCGSALTLIAFISYLFDAYPARGTLSALTAAACLRIFCAGWLPIVILQMFTALTPAWALSTFGFIAIAMIPIPYVLFFFGKAWRSRSRYAGDGKMVTEDMMGEGQHGNTMGEGGQRGSAIGVV